MVTNADNQHKRAIGHRGQVGSDDWFRRRAGSPQLSFIDITSARLEHRRHATLVTNTLRGDAQR
jgi:hypothetical protein